MRRLLYGKGVWAWMESEIPRSIEMAQAIGARIVLFKTGQEGEYYEQSARRVAKQITAAGLVPLAWPVITCHRPDEEAQVAIQSILDGYVGLVFDIEQPAAGQFEGARRLGEQMMATELPPEVMFFTSMPNISAYPEIPYIEMARFCRGGFMPQAYATFKWSPRYTLEVVAYGEFERWRTEQALDLPIYPVLGFYTDEHGKDVLSTAEILAWLANLERFRPTFFSVFRAGVCPESAWPLLARIKMTPPGEQPPPPPMEGVYVTVRPGDTIVGLCTQYRCDVGQFWDWNGHLWDAAGKPREPRSLQYGWIVRVG